MSNLPRYLRKCNPKARNFPVQWRESYFRRHYNEQRKGYVCPDCDQAFSGPAGFRQLVGDHIIPRSKGGLTVWENLILRCQRCTAAKSTKT